MVLHGIAGLAEFHTGRMTRVALASGGRIHAGLNCFLPGQEHAAHVHADQDKLYQVFSDSGEAIIGSQTHAVAAGDLVLAPAGVAHGMRNPGPEPLVVLVVMAPPPRNA